jgi:hypothetical protein
LFAEFGEFLPSGGGMLYWVALVALAGGLTLLLTSAFVRWWHPVKRIDAAAQKRRGGRPLVETIPGQEILTTRKDQKGPDIPLMRLDSPPARPAGAMVQRDREGAVSPGTLHGLVDRLQKAADRLEGMTCDPAPALIGGGDSTLKPLGGKVEYVFRASRH